MPSAKLLEIIRDFSCQDLAKLYDGIYDAVTIGDLIEDIDAGRLTSDGGYILVYGNVETGELYALDTDRDRLYYGDDAIEIIKDREIDVDISPWETEIEEMED